MDRATLARVLASSALGPSFSVTPTEVPSTYTVSYAGDPEPFVDCGERQWLYRTGEKLAWVPAARQELVLEAHNGAQSARAVRSMHLTATVQLVAGVGNADSIWVELRGFEYRLRRTMSSDFAGSPPAIDASIRFSSPTGASFAAAKLGPELKCVPNGDLARQLLTVLSALRAPEASTPVPQTESATSPLAPAAAESAAPVQRVASGGKVVRAAAPAVKLSSAASRKGAPAKGKPADKLTNAADVMYLNTNKDPTCKRIVDKLFALDRNPRFDWDVAIRRRWQAQADVARAHGCDY